MWRHTSAKTLALHGARKSSQKVSLFFLLLLRRHLPSQLSIPILMRSSGAKDEYVLFHWASFAFVLVTQDAHLLHKIGFQLNPSIKNLGCPNLFHISFLSNQSPVSSVQFSHLVVSDSLRPHGLQHARCPCPSPTPGACSNSCPLNWWCHSTISSSVIPSLVLCHPPSVHPYGCLMQQ